MKKVYILFIIIVISIPASSYAESILKFGIFPMFNPKILITQFKPIAERIQEYTGLKVQMATAADRMTFIQRTIDNSYDLIWINNAGFFDITEKGDFYVIASGNPGFRGVVMVRNDCSIKCLADLKGCRIGAINENSVAGYLFFRNAMADIGLYAPEDYSIIFNENCESLPFKVLTNSFDAVVFSEDTYLSSELYNLTHEKLRIIASSIEIPQFPFVVSSDLNIEKVTMIQDAIVSISAENNDGKKVMENFGIKCFDRKTNSDYEEFKLLYAEIKSYDKNIFCQ